MRLLSILQVQRAARLGLLLGMPAACAEEGSSPQANGGVEQRDSAGIVIIETPGAAARAPIGWTVDEVPDLQLGSVTGEGPEQFYLIGGRIGKTVGGRSGGIAGLPDGRIVVLNGGSGELRFFDGEGRFLNRVGGLGDGPGEFRSPVLVPYVSSDSLLIHDTRHRRFTLFSSDGQAHRNFPRSGLTVTGWIRGASSSGILTTTAPTAVPGQVRQSNPTAVRWIDLESGRAEIVAQFDRLLYALGDIYIVGAPLDAYPAAAMAANGFFVTGGDAPDVRQFDTNGRLVRIFRVAEAPRPVKPEDVDAVIDFQVNLFRGVPASQTRRVFAQMDFPDHWPAFQFVRVDRLGWIWVELFRPPQDDTQRWMIFDPSGVARGTLELPPGLEVHDIGRDYVLGRWLDDMRVEHVRRYRLDRGATATRTPVRGPSTPEAATGSTPADSRRLH